MASQILGSPDDKSQRLNDPSVSPQTSAEGMLASGDLGPDTQKIFDQDQDNTLWVPPEVLDTIFSLAGIRGRYRDSTALGSCSLVCRSWRAPAQRILFQTLNVTSLEHRDGFHSALHFLRDTPHVATLVRELCLRWRQIYWQDPKPSICWHIINAYLQSLPHLQRLVIRNLEFGHERENVTSTPTKFWQCGETELPTPVNRTSLDQLVLSDLTGSSSSDPVQDLTYILNLCSSIGSVHATRLSHSNSPTEKQAIQPLVEIVSVRPTEISFNSADPLRQIMQSTPAATESVTRVRCFPHTWEEIDSFRMLLEDIGPKLQYISLDPIGIVISRTEAQSFKWERLGLALCTNLQEMRFVVDMNELSYTFSFSLKGVLWAAMLDIISLLPRSTESPLQRITIDICILLHRCMDFLESFDWPRMDSLLSEFPNLKAVSFGNVSDWDNLMNPISSCSSDIRAWLPTLQSRDLLQFS